MNIQVQLRKLSNSRTKNYLFYLVFYGDLREVIIIDPAWDWGYDLNSDCQNTGLRQ